MLKNEKISTLNYSKQELVYPLSRAAETERPLDNGYQGMPSAGLVRRYGRQTGQRNNPKIFVLITDSSQEVRHNAP